MLVRVGYARYVGGVVVDNRRVVNVRDLSYRDSRVGDVHIVYVARAGSIPRYEDFTRSQREPPDSHANAKANSDAESAAAHEGD